MSAMKLLLTVTAIGAVVALGLATTSMVNVVASNAESSKMNVLVTGSVFADNNTPDF